ncbi:lysophospholipid acyltransferase family protein [Reinekea marina]|uniref:Lysophospholipid acyltransferase family protein n=1 Tax=Reinekea marina TaxID=1310421 RepID=A0ABV7WUY6_9GAMM|nr:lysophospholipid acyltransferase family protein [Reinekea marina]MDN3650015.1 lysophospholipid acyltransferase family protein [Reinekea marina]
MSEFPKIPDSWDRFGNRFSRWLGRTVLKAWGWKVEGEIPDIPKAMFTVAPHTSNWDFPIGLMVMFAMDFKVYWMGKHTLFSWPFNGIMTKWGGIPVYRHAPKGLAEQIADRFKAHETMLVAIAPEGTRKKVGHLKSGFLRIAKAANVPVFRVTIDYKTKTVRFLDLFYPTDSVEKDAQECYEFFGQYQGKIPSNY